MAAPQLLAALGGAAAVCLLFVILFFRRGMKAWEAEAGSRLNQITEFRQRTHAVLNALPEGIIEVDCNGAVRAINQVAAQLTGWGCREALGRAADEVFPLRSEGETDSTQELIEKAVAAGSPIQASGVKVLAKGGTAFLASYIAAPVITSKGKTAGVVLAFWEVIESGIAEVSAQRLASIVENSDDAIVGKTLQGIVTSWNRGAERIFGYSAVEMIGRPISRLIPGDLAEDMDQILATVARGESIEHYVTHRVTKEGKRITISLKVSPIRDRTGQIVGVSKIARDITHQQLIEERLGQAQKMEMIGQLAGCVAHDFNNLLTVINGYANLAAIQLPAEHPAKDCLRQVEAAGDRAVAMTRQLLAFSRKQFLQPQRLQLNDTIQALHPMFMRLVRENIEFSFHLDPAARPVEADRTQLEQVLLNLVVNASDAMAEGGKITIETGEAFLDENYARDRSDVEPGHYVMLAVTDSGTGIDPAIGKHVFEPFFTTKPAGKGTGLGLSTAYGIVKQSGGHLAFYSELGIGTTFRVYLPVAPPNAGEPPVVEPGPAVAARGTEVILVVEDDNALLKFTAITLRELGYTVYPAAPGDEAIRIGQMLGEDLDLLVTDVVMPGIGGRKLVGVLMPFAPKMKVLYISGYAETGVAHNGILEPDMAFLAKPFRADQLAGRVREVLELPR